MTFRDHENKAEEKFPTVRCAVITMSDTRTEETDTSGKLIVQFLIEAGHGVAEKHIIPDEPTILGPLLDRLTNAAEIQAILITGGTGISPRDRTHETVVGRLDRTLDGFGELFRMLSWEDIGAAAMFSRAVGGVRNGRIILAMPGSRGAVDLAMTKLVVPQIAHLVWEATR